MNAKRLQTPVLTAWNAHEGGTARRASDNGCTDTAYAARYRPHRGPSLMPLAIGAVILLGAATSEGAWLRWTNPKYNAAVDDSGYVQCDIDLTKPLGDLATVRIYLLSIRGGVPHVIARRSVAGRAGMDDSIFVNTGLGAHLWMTAVDAAGNESCVLEQVYVGPVTAVPVEEAQAERLTSYRIFDVRGRLVHPVAAGVYFWERRYSSGRVETGKTVRVK